MATLGFVGCGRMGQPMAARLLADGHLLRVYDTNPGALQPLLDRGATAVATPAETVEPGGVVFTSLPGPAQVEAVVEGDGGLLSALTGGSIHVDLTTNSLDTVRALHTREREVGAHLIDAPVSGGAIGAQEGKLTVMASGDLDAFRMVEPIIGAFAETIEHCGEVGAGTMTKLINNATFLCAGLVLQEGLVAGAKAGLDVRQLVRNIKASSGNIYYGLTDMALSRDFENAFFTLGLAHKDVALAVRAMEGLDSYGPVTRAAAGVYGRAVELGFSEEVFLATLKAIESESNCELPKVSG